ncbi:MAG: glucuronate isomerase [Treponema sp.]|jgi:glucuronate isomerase|nr:glucuronate isomerase [Treponema sp.]
MQSFLDDDFLLDTETARYLYHETVEKLPIFDFHCHLSPKEIAENKRLTDLSEAWLSADHYKWRALRTLGVEERLITGDADSWEKFWTWAGIMPRLIGNPLYHWTHMELQRYFGIRCILDEDTAGSVWGAARERMERDDSLSVYGIFRKFNIYAVGTTDDPADSLQYHAQIRDSGKTTTKVLPSFRPDKAINIDKPAFAEYLATLGSAAGVTITSFDDVKTALKKRIEHFASHGCLASDHALEYPPFEEPEGGEKGADAALKRALRGEKVSPQDADAYKTTLLRFLAREYAEKNWVMQLHMNAFRNLNSRQFAALGPDTGYDASFDARSAGNLARLLDSIERDGGLPKTILYTLNPADYYPLATIMGCFQGGGICGKIQLGSGWWFCDHIDGMETQLRTLSAVGVLSTFVGMLTDSRSFLSYPRHEYFRRILCRLIGGWAERGEAPNDRCLLARMARRISFFNALEYFEGPRDDIWFLL